MTHRFPIKEIARQSGLGPATIDRVLNKRANVSPQAQLRVAAAIEELEAQERQLVARGRRLFVDVIVEAPQRFSAEARRAVEYVAPSIGAGVFRPRFMLQEQMQDSDLQAVLARILKRGSQGVCLKARDVPMVRDMVARLDQAGVPVVTLVTDVPASRRLAYVGLDNANAGRSAAYLVSRLGRPGIVLTTRSQDSFFGEVERLSAFADALAPGLPRLDVSGGGGLGTDTARAIKAQLVEGADITAVYSMGGGNRAILQVLHDMGHRDLLYIAHDLDAENRALLASGQIDFVLHHDLHHDMRQMFHALAAFHGLGPPVAKDLTSDVNIVTPFNAPEQKRL